MHFCRLESGVASAAFANGGNELNVNFGGTSDVRLSVFVQFYASFAVLDHDVATEVWLTLLACTNDAVVLRAVDLVAPDNRCCARTAIIAGNFDAVLVGLRDEVIDDA